MMRHLYGLRRGQEVQLFVIGKPGCDQCGSRLELEAIHLYSRAAGETVLCLKCYREVSQLAKKYTEAETRLCLCADDVQHGALAIVSPASFTYGRYEDVPTTGVKIIDRTKHAGRPGYTLDPDAQVGKSIEQLDDEREAFLEEFADDPMTMLEWHRDTDRYIDDDSDDRRLLE